jgi:CubicO group peptidase (beta-lactamase class C family)
MGHAAAASTAVQSAIGLFAAWLESQRAYAGIPGVSAGIVHDQELVWAAGFGLASLERREPATPATLYRIASITKVFTATALLQLRDAGRLRLDDPVAAHLPWFAIQQPHADAPVITIRHLLTHAAGLPREAGTPYWADGNFPSADELRGSLGRLRTVLPPETRWKYSNLGLALAGEIVAAVSGQPYAAYVRERILEPLGMCDTLVESPAPGHPGLLATGYTRRLPGVERREPVPHTDTRGLTPAANMTTSVRDLARFAMLQFRGGPAGGAQILRGSTLREMHRIHWLEPDWQAGWGLGFHVWRDAGQTLVGHGGRLRGYRTQLLFSPADRVAVIVMTNADDGTPLPWATRAFHWVAPALAAAVAPIPVAGPDPAWTRYVGRYRSPWGDSEVLLHEGGLVLLDPSQPDPLWSLSRLVPVAEHAFRIETRDGYGSAGELVVFELTGNRVTRVRIGDNYTYPVADW